MKVIKFLFACIIFFSSCIPGTFSQVPLNWTIDEVNPGEDLLIRADDGQFTQGDQSCYLQLLSGAVPYLISGYYFVSLGAEYQFSLDVFDNDTSGQVKIYADFYDTYGFDIFGEEPQFSVDTNIWQTISWQGTVPQQAVVGYVLVKYYCQPNLYSFLEPAEVWIDNVRFQESGGDNLVANGSFENWALGFDDSQTGTGSLFAFPNPAKDFVIINLSGPFETIRLLDMTGREQLVIREDGNHSTKLDLTGIPGGMYVILARMKGGSVISTKLFISGK